MNYPVVTDQHFVTDERQAAHGLWTLDGAIGARDKASRYFMADKSAIVAKLPSLLDLLGSLQKPRSHNTLRAVVRLSGTYRASKSEKRDAVGVAN